MKSRFLSALVAALMACCLLPAPALAADPDVYVGGTLVSGGGYWKSDGAGGIAPTTAAADDYTVYYANAGATPTLTLRGANITKHHAADNCGIDANGALHIILEGNSTVAPYNSDVSLGYIGIRIAGALTVSGSGSLDVVTPDDAGGSSRDRYGIYTKGSITFTSGSLTSTGGKATAGGNSYGIWAEGGITVSAGSLTGISNGAQSGNSYGISVASSITVNGGKLTGTGGDNSNVSCGVNAAMTIVVNGGTLSGKGGTLPTAPETGDGSYGIYANTISLQAGDTTAETTAASGTYGSVNQRPFLGPGCQWKKDAPGNPYQIVSLPNDITQSPYLRVTSDKPTITTTALPDGQVNAPYSTQLTATILPTSTSIIWTLENGTSLPAGLSMSITGLISGTPNATVTAHPITVQATNGSGSVTATLFLTIAPIPPVSVAFEDLTDADGSDVKTTTTLTLSFDQDIPELTAGDITVTGATKGTLTPQSGAGAYALSISDITVEDQGTVSVAVAKSGFSFAPARRNVAVRVYTPPAIDITPTNVFLRGNAPGNLTINVGQSGRPPRLADFDSLEISLDGSSFAPFVTWGYWEYEGSIHLEMFKLYLDTLAPGTYTLRVNLKGNYAGQSFATRMTVLSPSVPQTGDSATPGLWLVGLLMTGVGLAVFTIASRHRRYGKSR